MRLDTRSRQEIIKANYKAYRSAGKKGRGEILDRLVPVTGMNRDYMATVSGRYVPKESGAGTGRKKRAEGNRGGRPPVYRSPAFVKALAGIRDFLDCPCGKLLAPLVRANVGSLESSRKIGFGITAEIRPLLLRVSAAEMDILLKPERKNPEIRGKSLTKAGPVLKNGIPVRTFFNWDGRKPGFFEMDRVAHCGSAAKGQFGRTLTATDVCSGWTEERALPNNARFRVREAAKDIRSSLPFPMCGIDTDNGGEFTSRQLLQWRGDNRIEFTRGRPYRKNDNCFVEQKNRDAVRKTAGYFRYDTPGELAALAEVYRCLCPPSNYFYPSTGITGKIRLENGRYKKIYDGPKTPYRRLLESEDVSDEAKAELKKRAAAYNLVDPRIAMDKARDRLLRITREKANVLNASCQEVSARF